MNHRGIHMNFNDLSRHRSFLYGFSALWILLFHCSSRIPSEGILLPLSYFQTLGNCGVEIFLLLSGFGLYHSMNACSDIGTFYKKRLLRVFLPSFFAMSVFNITKDSTLLEYIGSSTFIGYWFNIKTVWYVAFILTMYLFYPFLYRLQKRNARSIVMLIVLSLVLSFLIETFHLVDRDILRGISRIPVFLLGCLIAPWVIQRKPMPTRTFPVSFISAMLMTALWKSTQKYGYYYFFRSLAYITYAILAILCLCVIADIMAKNKPLHGLYRCLAFCGGISLEIYLVFERMLGILWELPGFYAHPCGGIKLDLAAAILTLILAVLLQNITRSISKGIEACRIPGGSNGSA